MPVSQSDPFTKPSALIISTIPIFPARENGLSIRYAPILERLSTKFEIDVALVVEQPSLSTSNEGSTPLVRRTYELVRERPILALSQRARARVMSTLGCTVPTPVFRHDRERITKFLQDISHERYAIIILTDSTLSNLARKAFPKERLVVDAIDSRYLLHRRSTTRSLLGLLESFQMKSWEQRIASYVDHVTYISDYDMRSVYGATTPENVSVIPNGIYESDFRFESGERDPLSIVFLGHMGYRPNILAAERAASVLQRVRTEFPGAQLHIVGRSPTERVLMLSRHDGVTVTGTVPSVWPYLCRAAVCLFPMIEGAGQQNKVLEAMRVGTPVVTTRVGNLGVGAIKDSQILLGESDQELAQQVIRVLRDRMLGKAIGQNGMEYVSSTFSWERSWALIEKHWL